MAIIGEVGIAQLRHVGEELCGDNVEIIRNPDETVIVLSDGLGSGVKANILSSLTAKICSKMIAADVPIEDVVDTLVNTLPTCSERGVAYSTFSILRLYNNGVVYMVDFDGCPMVRITKDKEISAIETNPTDANGKTIHETSFRLEAGETIVIVSDGVVQAGLGEMLPFGLGTDGLIDTLQRFCDLDDNVQSIAWKIVNICKSYYMGEPGDDTTAVVVRLKEEQSMVIMTGPPVNPADDARMVSRFEATEGIITLSAVMNLLEDQELPNSDDGATLLLEKIMESDRIVFLQGMATNIAMKDNMPVDLDLRDVIVEKLAAKLRSIGKIVEIVQYD